MKLLLLRHAVALSRDEWSGEDSKRPLTVDGLRTAERVGKRLADLGLGIACIVTSPYERALRTAAAVHDALPDVPLVEDVRLRPDRFTGAELDEIVSENEDGRCLLLVGHDPSMSDALADLIGGGRFTLRKGGLVRVDLDPADTGSARLVWFIPPKML